MERSIATLTAGTVVAGIAVRVLDWFLNPSLWVDEAFLAVGLVGKSFHDLIAEPLPYHQVAPPGFVLMARLFVVALGTGERALRLPALAAGCIAVALFPSLARRFLRPTGVVFATSLVALLPALVSASNQVKPYAFDLLAGVLIPLLVVRFVEEPSTRRAGQFALAAVALSSVSFGGWLLVASVAVASCFSQVLRTAFLHWKMLWAGAALAVAAGATGVASVSLRMPAAVERYYRNFWGAAFPEWQAGATGIARWIFDWITGNVAYLFAIDGVASILISGLLMVGAGVGVSRGHLGVRLLATSSTLAFSVAGLGRYPSFERTSLALTAGLVLAVVGGISWGSRRIEGLVSESSIAARMAKLCFVAVAIFLLSPALKIRPGVSKENLRSVVQQLSSGERERHPIYVFYSAVPAWTYYVQHLGFANAEFPIHLGRCHRRSLRPYLEEIELLTGSPAAWIVFSHTAHTPAARQERQAVESYLEAVGVVAEKILPSEVRGSPTDDAAYLVRFSTGTAERTVTAAEFDLPDPIGKGSCALFSDPDGTQSRQERTLRSQN